MYAYLLVLHSLMRWLILLSLLYAFSTSIVGRVKQNVFTKRNNAMRHITATIAHIQLAVGYTLYFNSPFITYFRQHYHDAAKHFDYLFFGLIHITLMTAAVICITIGSSLAKRKQGDTQKFSTMAVWFGIALLIIFIAIPWPFSPLAQRPYVRTF